MPKIYFSQLFYFKQDSQIILNMGCVPSLPPKSPESITSVSEKFENKTNFFTPILILATPNLKKQISGSQHSSISQADDFSSPYARVRSPPHDYDKVKREEHPYAQVVPNRGGLQTDGSLDETDGENSISCRQSMDTLELDGPRENIPAASAIAGRVSASQDLPYMTPPIVQPGQHFSGDSQDSSSK